MRFNLILFGSICLIIFITGCMSEKKATTDISSLDLKERDKLIIGTDPTYAPMEFIDAEGNFAGIDVDIATEIASLIGVEAEIKNYDWDYLFEAVKSGEIDFAISSITITIERSQDMLFSAPYFNGGQVIIVRTNNYNINEPQDLKEKRIGVIKGTTSEEAALEYTDPSLVEAYDLGEEVVEALKKGEVDAMINDYVVSVNYVRENPDLKLAGEPFTQEFYGIATKKTNIALMNEINSALRHMKRTGKIKEIEGKWVDAE